MPGELGTNLLPEFRRKKSGLGNPLFCLMSALFRIGEFLQGELAFNHNLKLSPKIESVNYKKATATGVFSIHPGNFLKFPAIQV